MSSSEKISKKKYYHCPVCGYYSRYNETYSEAKMATVALTGLAFGFAALHTESRVTPCLKCGNMQKLNKVFLEKEPELLVKEPSNKKLRYVRCKNDQQVIRYPLGSNKPKCPKCGSKNFEAFYQSEVGKNEDNR